MNSRPHSRPVVPWLPLSSFPPSILASFLPCLPFLSSRDEKFVTATPLDSAHTNCDVCKSFRIRSYVNCRVSSAILRSFFLRQLFMPLLPLCFQSIAHSLAQRRNRNSFPINRFRTLSHATGGAGGLLFFLRFLLPPLRPLPPLSLLLIHPSHCAGRRTVPQWPLWRQESGKQVRPLRCLRGERTAGSAVCSMPFPVEGPGMAGIEDSDLVGIASRAWVHRSKDGSTCRVARAASGKDADFPSGKDGETDSGRKGRQCPIGLAP